MEKIHETTNLKILAAKLLRAAETVTRLLQCDGGCELLASNRGQFFYLLKNSEISKWTLLYSKLYSQEKILLRLAMQKSRLTTENKKGISTKTFVEWCYLLSGLMTIQKKIPSLWRRLIDFQRRYSIIRICSVRDRTKNKIVVFTSVQLSKKIGIN